MSVNLVDAAIPPAELVVVSTATVVGPAELQKSPEQKHISRPCTVLHPFGKPVPPHPLLTKIL